MVRDSVKTEAYFNEWIDYDQEVIQQWKSDIEGDAVAPYGKVQAASFIIAKLADRIIMRYSRGDALDNLQRDLEDLLNIRENLKRFCDLLPNNEKNKRTQYERLSYDNYLDFLWWLSFAVCLGMGENYIQRVLALIDNAGQDALLDQIAVKLGDQRKISKKLAFPKQYALLLEAIDAPAEDQSALVRKFLDGWYKGNKNVAAWYENHKGEDSGYVGYWCFEAALVVKLFNIDDAIFRTHMYYPVDLAHYA